MITDNDQEVAVAANNSPGQTGELPPVRAIEPTPVEHDARPSETEPSQLATGTTLDAARASGYRSRRLQPNAAPLFVTNRSKASLSETGVYTCLRLNVDIERFFAGYLNDLYVAFDMNSDDTNTLPLVQAVAIVTTLRETVKMVLRHHIATRDDTQSDPFFATPAVPRWDAMTKFPEPANVPEGLASVSDYVINFQQRFPHVVLPESLLCLNTKHFQFGVLRDSHALLLPSTLELLQALATGDLKYTSCQNTNSSF